MIKNGKNYIFIISLFIISIFIILLCVHLSSYVSFYADDMWLGMYDTNEKILDSLYKNSAFINHGGGYLCSFITKFFNFGLPVILGIHPSDFVCTGVGIIKGIISSVIFYLFARTIFFNLSSKRIFLICFLFITCYFFIMLFHLNSPIMSINNLYCRYIVPILFFILFWQYIYKNIIEKPQKTNFCYLFFILICAFIVETGIEILMYVSVLLLALIVLYNITCKIFKHNSLMFNLKKEFFIPAIFSYFVMFIYNFSPAYRNLVTQRNLNNFSTNIHYIKEFMYQYIDLYFIKLLPLIIFFIILTIASFYFASKRNEIQKAIFPLLLQISIFAVYLSLILLGKSYLDGDFWITEHVLQYLYYLIILYAVFINLGYVLNCIKELIKTEKNKNIFVWLVFSTGIILITFFAIVFKQIIIDIINNECVNIDSAITKERLYISEKLLRFYYLKNETPYLPSQFNKTDDVPGTASAFPWLIRFEDYRENPCKNSEDLMLTATYYNRIYKNPDIINIGYCFSDNALQKFYNDGGVFTKKELENIKFSKLFDKNFVYNNTDDEIVTPDEIIKKAESQF